VTLLAFLFKRRSLAPQLLTRWQTDKQTDRWTLDRLMTLSNSNSSKIGHVTDQRLFQGCLVIGKMGLATINVQTKLEVFNYTDHKNIA